MSWGKLLQPNLILGESILGLTPALLQQHQLKGLLLDVDETLVPFREASTTPEVLHWFEEINAHAAVWLISNNVNEGRIRRIADYLSVPYLCSAGKPSRRKLRQAVASMDLPPAQVAMVGDRLFTDVLAGNRLGLFTVLVEPMTIPGETIRHNPLRSLEVWLSPYLGISLKQQP